MLLCIDVGNSNITLGLFADGRLLHTFRLQSRREQTPDDVGAPAGCERHDHADRTIRIVLLRGSHAGRPRKYGNYSRNTDATITRDHTRSSQGVRPRFTPLLQDSKGSDQRFSSSKNKTFMPENVV